MKKALLLTKTGFSLIEILVAISVFLIFVVATVSVFVSTNRQVSNSSHKAQAVALAHEALEAVRNIRDADFNNLIDGTYGLGQVANHWSLTGAFDITNIFNRQIIISTISPSQKKIQVTISWADQINQNNSIVEETYLTAWAAPLNIGLTMDKIVINHGGNKVPSDFLPYNLSSQVLDNSIDPPVLTNIETPILWSPTTMTLGPNSYSFLTTTDPNYTLTLSADCLGQSLTLVDGQAKLCNLTYEQNVAPTVTDPTAAAITPSTVSLGANVTSLGLPALISERGICYGLTPAPNNCLVEGGTTTGVFNQNIAGLSPSTLYYYRGYAINSIGTAYTVDASFTTSSNSIIPTVTNPTASFASMTATLGANVTSLGLPALISERGICYGLTPAPTNCLVEGGTTTGVFSQNITGLIPGTLYYYRGYAINSTGTAYTIDDSFTTLGGTCYITGIIPTLFDSSGTTSAVVNKPVGIIQNDIMFAYIMHNNSTDRLTTIPTGWVQIGRHKYGSANQAIYYKVAGSNEGSTYTFGLSSSSRMAVTINAYRGCFNPLNPIEAISNVGYTTNNTIYRAASMILPSKYTTIIIFPSVNASGLKTFTAPATQGGGWIEDYANGNSSSQFSRSAYSKLINISGATGLIDSLGYSASTGKHAFAVALKPL